MLTKAIVSITLALIFYTIGVWGEKLQGKLKVWHLITFYLGLVLDATGTTIMSSLSGSGFALNFHGIVGLLAIILMLFHAVWASLVITKGDDNAKINFHKLSIIVWCIWLIPYISGMMLGMGII